MLVKVDKGMPFDMDTKALIFEFFSWLMQQGIVVHHSSKAEYMSVFVLWFLSGNLEPIA